MVIRLIIAALIVALVSPAMAQTKVSGLQLAAPLQNIISILQNWGPDDINGAEALATQIEGLQDPVGKACWASFANLGAVTKAHPLPLTVHLATDLEAVRLFAMALKQVCANPNCTQLFADLKNQIATLAPLKTPFQIGSICASIL